MDSEQHRERCLGTTAYIKCVDCKTLKKFKDFVNKFLLPMVIEEVGNADGVFIIIFKKINGEWKIIADMSC